MQQPGGLPLRSRAHVFGVPSLVTQYGGVTLPSMIQHGTYQRKVDASLCLMRTMIVIHTD